MRGERGCAGHVLPSPGQPDQRQQGQAGRTERRPTGGCTEQRQAAVGAWGISAFSQGFLKCHSVTSPPELLPLPTSAVFLGRDISAFLPGRGSRDTGGVTTFLPAANPCALRWHFIAHGKAEQLPLPVLQPRLKAGRRVMGTSRRARKEEEKPGQLCSSFRCRNWGLPSAAARPLLASHPVTKKRPSHLSPSVTALLCFPYGFPRKGLRPGKPSWSSTFPEAAPGSSSPGHSPTKGHETAPKGQVLLRFIELRRGLGWKGP